ncbi:hypothetical protein EDD96_5276 [Streptomyces sp. Ag109_G2-6]|uniref:hypothetical protein n=1 Tax=Streptomyces TaxID=1883 RepID=UPI000C2B956F|nr:MULTISPECIES: hypothetical protein [Streptomyces]RPF41473.1 hypothetical protein EDD96_5276 [Streptomyces sp. Ag109_G2-6]
MSTAPQPSAVPQPPVQPEAVRAALAQVAPQLLADFDRDRAASTARARRGFRHFPPHLHGGVGR